MFLVVPYHVDVPMRCVPWMNWVLMGLTVLLFPFGISDGRLTAFGEEMALSRGNWPGLVGHVFVHADLFHLLGNMLFLWVFGNAVCAKVGNLLYPVVYLGLGVAAGLGHLLFSPNPAVGASGAINGVVGMFVVFYLLNEISCWYWYWFFSLADMGTFSLSSFWMVLFWFVFDVWGALAGQGSVAYLAHLAGFLAGFGLAVGLLMLGLIEMDRGERSLLQVMTGGGEKEGWT